VASKATICTRCGGRVVWVGGGIRVNADDGKKHTCKPKVKVYSKDEIKELERTKKDGDKRK
jgi:hypothetical protein